MVESAPAAVDLQVFIFKNIFVGYDSCVIYSRSFNSSFTPS